MALSLPSQHPEDPLNTFPDPIVSADEHGRIVRWNRACVELLGVPAAEAIGRPLDEVLHLQPRDLTGASPRQQYAVAGDRAVPVDVTRWDAHEGGRSLAHLCLRDASDRATQEQEAQRATDVLRRQARSDALTGLANRHEFDERLAATSAAGRAAGGHWALVVIDLDGFKPINDSLGHAVGDEVLAAVAGRLRRCARPDDTVARFGGDEFVVLTHMVDAAAPGALTQRIRQLFDRPIRTSAGPLRVRASVGLAVGEPGADPADLLRRADKAMYRVKLSRSG